MCYASRDYRAEQEARGRREAARRPEKAEAPKKDREIVRVREARRGYNRINREAPGFMWLRGLVILYVS